MSVDETIPGNERNDQVGMGNLQLACARFVRDETQSIQSRL